MIGFPGVEQVYDPTLSGPERAYVRLFGIPVNGLRIRLRRVLPATRGDFRRILDAGCGIGVFTMELAKRHPRAEVVGIDFEPVLVERANHVARRAGLINCRFEVGDVTDLGFDGGFDLVVSVDNLEHVQDDVAALTNLRRALAPGGKLVVHVPGYYRRWLLYGKRVNFDVPGHMRPGYLAEELVERMQRAGLEVESTSHTYGILETFTNNLSYLITGADRKNRQFYALVFPLLLAGSYLGRWSKPSWGAGLLAVAHRSDAGRSL
jgi:SAM-dependent methyltransferase